MAQLGKSNARIANTEVCAVAAAIRQARLDGRPVVQMIGGHPIKLGLSRFLIDLIEKGFITCLATNGAGLIHDFELASMGKTIPVTLTLQTATAVDRLRQEHCVLLALLGEGAFNGSGFRTEDVSK